MFLRRIEVRDFRKITHQVVEGLGNGLNVVVGDNEAGKSTLLAALRTAFFERHTVGGKPVEAMLPYGANVRPEILVDFEIAGQPWRLRKAFNQKPEAELVGPNERQTGGAVEDRLATLLGFVPPARGGAKAEEHHGTHGLLWVEQGTRETLGVGAGRDTLAAALEREVGQVAGGDRGRALLAAAENRRDTFWTKTDRPRGDPKTLRDAAEALAGERDAIEARLKTHDAKISRLSAIGDILDRAARENRLANAVATLQASRQTLAQAEALGEAVRRAEATRSEAGRERTVAAERRARRIGLVAGLGAARGEADATAREARESDTVASGRDAQATAAAQHLRVTRTTRETAEAEMRALDGALARTRAEAALAQQTRQVDLADDLDRKRQAAAARAGAGGPDREDIAELVRLEKTAETARAELNVAGVQIGFAPDGAQTVSIDDVPHPASQTLTLTRDAVLWLEGFGRVAIRPGGGTAELQRRAEAADRALLEALGRAGVASITEARLALDTRTAALTEVAALQTSLKALAPKGLDALRGALALETARLAQPLRADVALVGAGDHQARLDHLAAGSAALAAAVAHADEEDRRAATLRQEALLAAARLAERAAAATRHGNALAADLAAARAELDDDRLDGRLGTADAALAAAVAAETEAKRLLDAADPEAARLVVARSEAAERAVRADRDTLDRERRDLLAELRGGGSEGLSERLGEINELLEDTRRRLAAKDLEATASRLLHDTLVAAQREAKDRWLGPVRTRVAPYLRLMAPGAEIMMSEQTLEIEGLRRNGVTEPFSALSMGAREQVAVMTRLALADVLRDAGHPAVVILDDSLVNTDDTRLDRMHNVLTLAARTLQIVILTCREREFIGLGQIHRM